MSSGEQKTVMMCDDDQIRTFFILTFFQKKKKRFTEINYSVIRGGNLSYFVSNYREREALFAVKIYIYPLENG